MDPVGTNRPEGAAEAHSADVALGLGGEPADPVGVPPEHEAETRAMHRIASVAGMARDAGAIPAVLCPISICSPPFGDSRPSRPD
jgi:hypothetical protein